jgi:glucose/arabinose dehydrogenase
MKHKTFTQSLSCLISSSVLSFVPMTANAQVIDMADIPTQGARAPDSKAQVGISLSRNDPVAPEQKPAFEGQTRAPAVSTQTPLNVQVVTRNLSHPWGLAFIGDDLALISEKPGTMRIVNLRSGEVVGDVQDVPNVIYGGDAGLLDVVVHPQFAVNRQIFFTYVEPRAGGENGIVVAKARLKKQERQGEATRYALEGLETVIRVEPGIVGKKHYGSRLVFDREGYLFVSLSERFFSPYRDEAQSLYSWAGKILRISTDGAAAPGNPFDNDRRSENHTRGEIWSYGHRNPQGLAIHPVTQQLWDGEHGPQGGDEINLITRGKNYGWPLAAYGKNYDLSAIYSGRTQLENTEQPRYYWDPAIAPGGMSFYAGDLIPEWKNNLFVAALAGQHLARLVIRDDKIVGEERLLQDQHQRIRDVKQGPDGALWVITDDAAGRLIRIAPHIEKR